MILLIFLIIATVFLAYANGANDNFKGVATLFGSHTTNYKTALTWATITTALGSIVSMFFAAELISRFSGKGLVPDAVAASAPFLLAVALGAGATVILATLTGFPISTTHSLTGALVGAGLMAVGNEVNYTVLGSKFFLPLLVSPFMAAFLAGTLYVIMRKLRRRMDITHDTSFYVAGGGSLQPQEVHVAPAALRSESIHSSRNTTAPTAISVAYNGTILDISAQRLLDIAHYFSTGVVSFARGLNDTPKIVALLLAVNALGIRSGMLLVAIAIALGGILNARKVAHTMSLNITRMNPGQGFTANIATGLLVIFASRWGLPVSTTHVSVGALFGLGTATRKINTRKTSEILLSWILTLPIAAALAGAVYWVVG